VKQEKLFPIIESGASVVPTRFVRVWIVKCHLSRFDGLRQRTPGVMACVVKWLFVKLAFEHGAVSPHTDAPIPELPPAIEMQADVLDEMNDPLALPQPDAPTKPEEILQMEPTTGLAEDQVELPMSTRRTTRLGREVRTPQHLRDFVLLTNLSMQTYFARNLPRVRCEVINHKRLSTLRWDNLLTSLRSGSNGSLLSFVQKHSEDGYINEWHPSLLATKANTEDNPTWSDAMNGPYSQGIRKACQLESIH
jgi:hypothetical protein